MTTYYNSTDSTREVRIFVQSRRLPLDQRLRAAVPRILATALDQFAPHLRAIDVWLEDVNGPRGGVDTRCRIEVSLRPRGQIVVSSLATNEYVAVADAAARARTVIGSRINRARTRRRRLTAA